MKKIFIRLAALILSLSAVSPIPQAGAWGQYEGGHHPAYGGRWARPNPVIVHETVINRRAGGCIGCGIGAAAVAGLAGGVIIGTTVVNRPQPIIITGPPIGMQSAALPPGCAPMNINGVQYYQCGPTWYQPFFGGNGVYYTVVPTP